MQNTPATVEVCGNAADDDCDGTLNNGCAQGSWCLDADGDGMGTLSNCVSSFVAIAGRVQNTLDCDDTSKFARPGAREACAPNLDLDCDGLKGSADPDAICYGTIRYSWSSGTQLMTVDLVGSQTNAITTTARWSEPNKDPRIGAVTAVEVGSDFGACWSLSSNCGRVLYSVDPLPPNPPVTLTFGLAPNGIRFFTPRVETSASEVVYLDLYNWAVVDVNAGDGVTCNVVPDVADAGLVTRCGVP